MTDNVMVDWIIKNLPAAALILFSGYKRWWVYGTQLRDMYELVLVERKRADYWQDKYVNQAQELQRTIDSLMSHLGYRSPVITVSKAPQGQLPGGDGL